MLQNIQIGGWWTGVAYVYKTGMLVWRIDYNNEDVNLFDNPNNTLGKPKVMIVPADGYVISDYNHGDGKDWTNDEYKSSLQGDPFPGTKNITQLLSVELNNSTLKKPFYNIKETNGVITFDYLDNISAIQLPSVDETDMTTKQIFSLDGRYLGNDASKLTKGSASLGHVLNDSLQHSSTFPQIAFCIFAHFVFYRLFLVRNHADSGGAKR